MQHRLDLPTGCHDGRPSPNTPRNLKRRTLRLALCVAAIVSGPQGCTADRESAPLTVGAEETRPDGSLLTPALQSILRGSHWLDSAKLVDVSMTRELMGTFDLRGGSDRHTMRLARIPLGLLAPRLHYRPHSPPDDFDAFNLALAEHTKNGFRVPVGRRGDTGAHFETDLEESVAWTNGGEYRFVPNPLFRPIRIALINNALDAGLWELSASDRAAEIHHSWFTFPTPLYGKLIADVNGIDPQFAAAAVAGHTRAVPLDLDRLRRVVGPAGPSSVAMMEASSPPGVPDRSLAAAFMPAADVPGVAVPVPGHALMRGPIVLADFVPPGKYSVTTRRTCNLTSLTRPVGVQIRRVVPLTTYDASRFRADARGDVVPAPGDYLEFIVELDGNTLVLGNVPLARLVPQEDFSIFGFGVGVFGDADLVERREILVREGPAPSYAYLTRVANGRAMVLSLSETGPAQISIRTHSLAAQPSWEITVTTTERLVELAKYRVDIPPDLRGALREGAGTYSSPRYLTARDDHIR